MGDQCCRLRNADALNGNGSCSSGYVSEDAGNGNHSPAKVSRHGEDDSEKTNSVHREVSTDSGISSSASNSPEKSSESENEKERKEVHSRFPMIQSCRLLQVSKLTDFSKCKEYDPSQELIFPSELKVRCHVDNSTN